MTQDYEAQVFKTPNIQTVLLSTLENIQDLRIQFQIHPWNLQLATILTHLCPSTVTTSAHSLSISPTSLTPPGSPMPLEQNQQQPHTSTALTMGTMSISSSLLDIIPIPTGQSIEYLNTLREVLLVLQKRIQQYNSLSTSENSFTISSATALENSISLVLK
jgi:hypothetical protein